MGVPSHEDDLSPVFQSEGNPTRRFHRFFPIAGGTASPPARQPDHGEV